MCPADATLAAAAGHARPVFGDAPALASSIRFLIGFIAVVQALLAARVVGVRLYRALRGIPDAVTERVPTAAMLAHGIFCAYVARVMFRRIPEAAPLDVVALLFFAAALACGAYAYTQIVVLTWRESHPRTPRGSGHASRRRARRGRSR